MLAKKAIVLPLLKHFLAGNKISGSSNANDSRRTRRPEDPFSAVEMPLGIQKMKNMEILSHVQVSDCGGELTVIAQLLKLRKLGVALRSKNAKLDDLLRQIENLSACLRSLSIRIDQTAAGPENQGARIPDALHLFPNFIERLSTRGIASGLIYIKDHHQLSKLTLSETFLGENDVRILGRLSKLRGLLLLHNSYTAGSQLSFKAEEFQCLRSLVVDCSGITNMSFDNGAAPNLEMIVWSFTTLEALSGLHNLWRIKKLELNGDCDRLDSVTEEIIWSSGHPNYPEIKHNPRKQHQEDGATAAEASSSSAP
ncbi:hypothetical protein BS78_10G244800 [Paspalum vaginatum]|nr:hypothetical protein BS78_10G244800 [Paspalum vaginatum]